MCMRMHPDETAVPRLSGSLVPWIPSWPGPPLNVTNVSLNPDRP